MIDLDVLEAINMAPNEGARPKLRECVKPLEGAFAQFLAHDGYFGSSEDFMVIAASTSRHCTVLWSSGWPSIAPTHYYRREVLNAIIKAVETDPATDASTNTIAAATAYLLGDSGIAEYRADARRLLSEGRKPIVVVLVGDGVTLVTCVGVDVPCVSVH